MRAAAPLLAALAGLVCAPSSQAQLPVVHSGGLAHVYATFPSDPAIMSFDADGDLFVGNFNSPGPPDVPAPVWKVWKSDSAVTQCAMVDDPDAVFIDRNGRMGVPGAVLVGGWKYTTMTGQVTSVAPGCVTTQTLSLGGCIGNISAFAEDASGRLFAANGSEWNVCRWTGSAWVSFIPADSLNQRIEFDGLDLYASRVAVPGSMVRRYDSGGALVDAAFARGMLLGVGRDGTDFEGVLVARTDTVLAVDPVTKAETLLLTGPGAASYDADFDAAGDMYLSQPGALDRVLHVTQSARTDVAAAARGAGALRLRVRPNPATAEAVVELAAPAAGAARVDLIDARGRRVQRLHHGTVPEGVWTRAIDLSRVARGVYFISVESRAGRSVERIVVR